MGPFARNLRWIAPSAVLLLAALLRLWALDRPSSLVFDELYYVRDAVSQLGHGFPTVWPDTDPSFGGERSRLFLDQAASIAHPPLGKWVIGLGVLVFGADNGWGWRSAVAIAGVATVGATMRLGWVLTRSFWVACTAGLLLAIDGVHIVMSRVALLDGILTFFVVLGTLCVVRDGRQNRGASSQRVLWLRPWLVSAGVMFGAAAGVKWSGLYPLAAFLVLLTLFDAARRLSVDRPPACVASSVSRFRVWVATFLQAVVTALLALGAVFFTYVSTWLGLILTAGEEGRTAGTPWWVSLWRWHRDTFLWHTSLNASHPYASNPWGWPIAWKPTAMFRESSHSQVAAITPLPNPLVTWGGLLAILLLSWVAAGIVARAITLRSLAPLQSARAVAVSVVLVGYVSGWLPWVLTPSRSAVFQFYSVVTTPFAAVALALVLASFASAPGLGWVFEGARIRLAHTVTAVAGRQYAAAIFVVMAMVLAVLFWPLWSGAPVEEWFYRAHLWLPSWS